MKTTDTLFHGQEKGKNVSTPQKINQSLYYFNLLVNIKHTSVMQKQANFPFSESDNLVTRQQEGAIQKNQVVILLYNYKPY